MRVLAVQHVPNEPMGLIEDILERKSIDFEYLRIYETNEVNFEKLNFTHLIVMGGPMGVYEESNFSFLRQEKAFIRDVVLENLPVLGICLGSQLIASALGKDVYPFKTEIGWYVVKKEEQDHTTDRLPSEMITFQWHNDTFDLPEGAKLLYSGDVKNQAFRFRNALGLQFHLEVTPPLIENWVKSEDTLSNTEKKTIIEKIPENIDFLNDNCERLLDAFLNL